MPWSRRHVRDRAARPRGRRSGQAAPRAARPSRRGSATARRARTARAPRGWSARKVHHPDVRRVHGRAGYCRRSAGRWRRRSKVVGHRRRTGSVPTKSASTTRSAARRAAVVLVRAVAPRAGLLERGSPAQREVEVDVAREAEIRGRCRGTRRGWDPVGCCYQATRRTPPRRRRPRRARRRIPRRRRPSSACDAGAKPMTSRIFAHPTVPAGVFTSRPSSRPSATADASIVAARQGPSRARDRGTPLGPRPARGRRIVASRMADRGRPGDRARALHVPRRWARGAPL